MGHVAFGNLAANHGAGNDFAVIVDGRNGDDLKPSFAPQPAQEMNVAGLAVAEAEIFSHENGPNQEIVYQDLPHKFRGRELCQFECEGKHDSGFESHKAEPFDPLSSG